MEQDGPEHSQLQAQQEKKDNFSHLGAKMFNVLPEDNKGLDQANTREG